MMCRSPLFRPTSSSWAFCIASSQVFFYVHISMTPPVSIISSSISIPIQDALYLPIPIMYPPKTDRGVLDNTLLHSPDPDPPNPIHPSIYLSIYTSENEHGAVPGVLMLHRTLSPRLHRSVGLTQSLIQSATLPFFAVGEIYPFHSLYFYSISLPNPTLPYPTLRSKPINMYIVRKFFFFFPVFFFVVYITLVLITISTQVRSPTVTVYSSSLSIVVID